MITPGMTREAVHVVLEEDSAARVSPLVPPVYASARMIAFAEQVCAELMAEHLAAEETSVGAGFQFSHDAPTPIGMRVTMSVKVVEVEGKRHVFAIEGRDELDRICTGRHERYVINRPKFMARLEDKLKRARN